MILGLLTSEMSAISRRGTGAPPSASRRATSLLPAAPVNSSLSFANISLLYHGLSFKLVSFSTHTRDEVALAACRIVRVMALTPPSPCRRRLPLLLLPPPLPDQTVADLSATCCIERHEPAGTLGLSPDHFALRSIRFQALLAARGSGDEIARALERPGGRPWWAGGPPAVGSLFRSPFAPSLSPAPPPRRCEGVDHDSRRGRAPLCLGLAHSSLKAL